MRWCVTQTHTRCAKDQGVILIIVLMDTGRLIKKYKQALINTFIFSFLNRDKSLIMRTSITVID